MRTAVRSGGSAAILVAVLAAGWAAGSASRPASPAPVTAGSGAAVAAGPGAAEQPTTPPGSSVDGITLAPRTTALDAGRPGEYVFTLAGPFEGTPRLAVVRRDAAVLLRPTPVADADGTWRAPLTLPAAGPYRVLVEVAVTDGTPRALAADLTAPGPFEAVPFTPVRVAEVDGYQVRLDGDLVPGTPVQVFATVGRGGRPVTDLEPLDGGFGRLEAVREGDLAPARVHPDATPPAPADRAGPGIAFTAEVPAAGAYRLFLGFRHGGVQRTAVFTVPAGTTG